MEQETEDLRVLSVVHVVIGWLAVVFGTIPPVFVLLVTMVRRDFGTLQMAPVLFTQTQMVLGLMLGVALWVYGILLNRAGHSIQERRHRNFILTINVASLLFVPFGTIVGLLTFATLAKPEVKALFRD